MLSSSAIFVASFDDGTTRSVSSANLKRKFVLYFVRRSDAFTAYAAGPRLEPWFTLVLILTDLDVPRPSSLCNVHDPGSNRRANYTRDQVLEGWTICQEVWSDAPYQTLC